MTPQPRPFDFASYMVTRFMWMIIIGGLAATAYSVATEPPPRLSVPTATPAPPPLSYPDQWIVYFSDRYGVPWQAAMALARSESGLQPDAKGSDGVSYGVMQLNSKYFVGSQRMIVEENVDNGVRYFRMVYYGCLPPCLEDFCSTEETMTRPSVYQCAVDRYRGKRR